MEEKNVPRQAQLDVVDFKALKDGDPEHSRKLYEACVTSGCFYLDVQSYPDSSLEKTLDSMYSLVDDMFDLPLEEKVEYDVDVIGELKVCGYKPIGRNTGGMPGGKDGFETFAVPKVDLMQTDSSKHSYPHPAPVVDHWKLLQSFRSIADVINQTILASLSKSLNLPEQESLQGIHDPNMSSPDMIRLLRYQPSTGPCFPHIPHTDTGSTTILFAKEGGLQILPFGSQQWEYVSPKPGHAIINLGDGMALLTNGLFRSPLHRVVPMPGEAMNRRKAFGYFLRAHDSTPMKGGNSPMIPTRKSTEEVLTSEEWLKQKFMALRFKSFEKKDEWKVGGGRENLPQ